MKHLYIANMSTSAGGKFTIQHEELPVVLREVRKYIKVDHGNRIRTALLEQGEYKTRAFGRKKSISEIYYWCNIKIERY